MECLSHKLNCVEQHGHFLIYVCQKSCNGCIVGAFGVWGALLVMKVRNLCFEIVVVTNNVVVVLVNSIQSTMLSMSELYHLFFLLFFSDPFSF